MRIHGEQINDRASILKLEGLSGHADQDELLGWAAAFETPPTHTYLVHGEPDPRHALARRLVRELGWETHEPLRGTEVVL